MPLITLTSDYGIKDHYLASVKGAIYSELPDAIMCDISHEIEPGNLIEASFILRNSYYSFPKGTVHLILVNELNEGGRWLVVQMDGHFFIGADNGLLSMINPDLRIQQVIEIKINQGQSLFPGRDFLGKAACHLIRGGKPEVLGHKVDSWKELKMYRHSFDEHNKSIMGNVVYVDNFGNLITNISKSIFAKIGGARDFEIHLPRNQKIKKLRESYFDVSEGKIIALFNSQDLLEIAFTGARGKDYNGANTMLGMGVRDQVTIYFS